MSSQRWWWRLAGVVGSSLVLVASGAAPAAASAVCAVSGSTLTIQVPDDRSTSVSVDETGTILVGGLSTCNGGTPTVNTIDSIVINGTGLPYYQPGFVWLPNITVDLTQPFGPGATSEGSGVSEIEFEFDNVNWVDIRGSGGGDTFVVGEKRLTDLNDDGDPDIVRVVGVGRYQLSGGGGNDEIWAAGGGAMGPAPDQGVFVDGGGGNDAIKGGNGADTITGADGDDIVDGGGGGDALGSSFAFPSLHESGSDIFEGGDGDDNIVAGLISGGPSRLFGGPGNDILTGSPDDNVLEGGEGNDSLSGMAGRDALHGAAGDDRLFGGPGRDLLDGGPGADREVGDAGNDVFDQGAVANGSDLIGDDIDGEADGFDTLDYSNRTNRVDVVPGGELPSGEAGENDYIDDLSIDRVKGGSAGDRFFGDPDEYFKNVYVGGRGNDVLAGGGGNDELTGGPGGDDIRGGHDHDILSGDDGPDELDGGPGADLCEGGGGRDVVTSCVGN